MDQKRQMFCAFCVALALALLVIQQNQQLSTDSSEMADYASETNGAKLIDTGDTEDYIFCDASDSWRIYVLSIPILVIHHVCPDAGAMIRPGAGTLPGECWAFKGSKGEATIRLAGTVRVTAISIAHIPADMSSTREKAPRLIQVEGHQFHGDPNPHDFGSFEYNKEGKPIQYFEVLHPSPKGYNFVRVRVLTNWGNKVVTCVSRVSVHGELETAQSLK